MSRAAGAMPVKTDAVIEGPETPKRISILGATGSIGTSTLDLVMRDRARFPVEALTANTDVDGLARAAVDCGANIAVIADPTRYQALKEALSGSGIEAAAGPDALVEAAARPADLVMAAITGAAGLAPTIGAVRAGSDVALANKECLVSAGSVFMAEMARAGGTLLPVDSEHNAIFQLFDDGNRDAITRIILTASGGPFRTWTKADMAAAPAEAALRHPNWEMGRKISIDSATMMNKGIELIEAHHLFAIAPARIEVLVHPQSVVHSLVEYADGSVLAQMAAPDMRVPIAYALAWPRRMVTPSRRLDLAAIGTLAFEAVDDARFPAISLCRACLERPASAATILNAANEIAVAAFLDNRIGFLDIAAIVEGCLDLAEKDGNIAPLNGLEDVYEMDRLARRNAENLCSNAKI